MDYFLPKIGLLDFVTDCEIWSFSKDVINVPSVIQIYNPKPVHVELSNQLPNVWGST